MRKRVREQNGLTEDKVEYQDIIWKEDLCFIRERTIFAPRRTFTLFSGAYDPDIPTWIGPFSTYVQALEYLRPGWRSVLKGA